MHVQTLWAKVSNHPGYLVSIDGNVQSLDRLVKRTDGNHANRRGKMLKKTAQYQGYLRVALNGKTLSCHRLVMMNFHPTSFMEHREVNHINGIKSDNFICNLEWVSRKENVAHALNTGLKSRADVNRKITFDDAQEIRKRVSHGESKNSLAGVYGVDHRTIRNICNFVTYKQ